MIDQEFINTVQLQTARCKKLLNKKREQHSAEDNDDRLSQFKTAAAFRGVPPIHVLGGMMVKTTTQIYDLIDKKCDDLTLWNKVITEHINYLLLLNALNQEELS